MTAQVGRFFVGDHVMGVGRLTAKPGPKAAPPKPSFGGTFPVKSRAADENDSTPAAPLMYFYEANNLWKTSRYES